MVSAMVASSATWRNVTTQCMLAELVQQHCRHRANLGQCVGLAEDAGMELAAPHRRVEQRRNQQNAHISAEDQHRDGDRHQSLVEQHQEEVLSSSLSATGSR